MINNRVYMHKNCLDVCILILGSFKVPLLNRYCLKVQWWNLGYAGLPWRCEKRSRFMFFISPKNWNDISNRTHIVRTKPGLP